MYASLVFTADSIPLYPLDGIGEALYSLHKLPIGNHLYDNLFYFFKIFKLKSYLSIAFAVGVVDLPEVARSGGGRLPADLKVSGYGIPFQEGLGR